MTTVTNEQFDDIRYEIEGSAAVVTIARPERYDAFRGRTVEELVAAFRAAWADRAVRAIILTGRATRHSAAAAMSSSVPRRATYITGQVLSVSGGLTMAG